MSADSTRVAPATAEDERHDRYLRARASHPWLDVDRDTFDAAWARRAAVGPIDEARTADVYLAAACEQCDEAALRWLREQIQRGVKALARRVRADVLADVESEVLSQVAVGDDKRPPRIREYSARGPLLGWLNVIIARTANARAHASPLRRSDVDIERAVLADLEQPGEAPELAALKSRFHGVLGTALRVASESLSPRDRALIAMHYLDSVSLEEIARAYQVHRATAARWLAQAREGFLEATRNALAERVQVPRLEIDSLVRVLQSQVDISLRQVIGHDE